MIDGLKRKKKPLCGKTDKGLAVSLDGAANGLVLSPAGDSMGKAHGWVVGEFLVGLEVGTAQSRGLNRDNVRKVNKRFKYSYRNHNIPGELECGNFGMTGGDATDSETTK